MTSSCVDFTSYDALTRKLFSSSGACSSSIGKVFSPYSIYSVLQVLFEASDDETRKILGNLLNLDPMSTYWDNFSSVTETLSESKEVKFTNSIFSNKSIDINEDFIRQCADTVKHFKFSTAMELVSLANDYVSKNTNRLIENLLKDGDVSNTEPYVFVNTVYFNSKWEHKFDNEKTRDDIFKKNDGSTVMRPLMEQKFKTRYFRNDKFQYIEMPYQHSKYVMCVILPKLEFRSMSVEKSDFESCCNIETFDYCFNNASSREVKLYFPKFKHTARTDFYDIISNLGSKELFDPRQKLNLSRLSNHKDVAMAKIIQEVVVIVDEEKTEAAAATFTTFNFRGLHPREEVMNANHTFCYGIFYRHSECDFTLSTPQNVPLFIGFYDGN
jgi:serine protease inhibitor